MTSIVLASTEPAVTIAPENVYFPFESGRLSYDCEQCGAKCCRGYGYALSTSELAVQLRIRPALRFFVDAGLPQSRLHQIGNCPPSCFFLDADARCAIHSLHGYRVKPETCRLFPFNQLRICDPYLIVLPHDEICPLGVTPLSGQVTCRRTKR